MASPPNSDQLDEQRWKQWVAKGHEQDKATAKMQKTIAAYLVVVVAIAAIFFMMNGR